MGIYLAGQSPILYTMTGGETVRVGRVDSGTEIVGQRQNHKFAVTVSSGY